MTARLAFLTLALVAAAGLVHAQSTSPSSPATNAKPAQTTKATETPAAAAQPARHEQQASAHGCYNREKVAMTDEYGFRYDSRGDRLNAAGCVIAPPHSSPGAKVARH